MHAIELTRPGNAFDTSALRDLPEPHPPGPQDVLLSVEYAVINPSDFVCARGTYPGITFPYIGGIEGLGRVLERGANVAHLNIGDLVLLPPETGTWRQRFTVPAADLWALPEGDAQQLAQPPISPPAFVR
ncbi:alcohol dehydrogenase catalytic domain-containing protein [Deinococcus pimensis]|uniref:alcohol dehydrogenase catalytic domain-containing protein n=1 Tax=Deinococcus pimensis TaxID=309888 RepID=UPI000484E2FC|nr:alcohol dehydrogenase catalytic domain-containing protein [Deinococcus pimensis]